MERYALVLKSNYTLATKHTRASVLGKYILLIQYIVTAHTLQKWRTKKSTLCHWRTKSKS